MTAAAHPAPVRHAVGLPALWFGLFGAPAAWSVQELLSYALVSHACYPSMTPRAGAAEDGVWTLALVVTIAAVALGAVAGCTALRSWRRTQPAAGDAEAEQLDVGEGRARFMAMSGVLVGAVFLLNLLMNAAVFFLVPPCG